MPSKNPRASKASSTLHHVDASQRYALRKSMTAFMPYMEKTHNVRAGILEQDSKKKSTLCGKVLGLFQTIRVRSSKDELQDPNSSVYGTEDPPRARFIDPGGIRRWLKACEMHHGTHCSSQANGLDTTFRGPSWLIETQNDCLVSGNSGRFYFALSYCWGSSVSTSLTVGNLDVLQERNALKKVSMVVPATIKDAMRLVLQLKGRYLWVDKLCIPQDDNVVKKKKLASMAMIYANAHVTVVTAQGMDANDGLTECKEHQPERTNHPLLLAVSKTCGLAVFSSLTCLTKKSRTPKKWKSSRNCC